MASYSSIIWDMLRSPNPSSITEPHWEPDVSMPDLSDRIVILTGPTSGIGYETLRQLVLSGAHVYLFGRSLERLEHTRSTIMEECTHSLANDYPSSHPRHKGTPGKMDLIQCDLSSIQSIKTAVEEFKSRESRVDLVFANAGIMQMGQTQEGYEIMFGTNVLGHHALIRLLLPLLQSSSSYHNSSTTHKTRIILTASDTHRWVNKPSHLSNPGSANMGYIHLYGRSKLGNILTASSLASLSTRENWGITVCSVHPGGVKSQLGSSKQWITKVKNWFLVPASLGAVTQLWAGTGAEGAEVHGKYLVPWAKVGRESDLARNEEVRKAVWEWCETECLKLGLVQEKLQ